MMALSRGFKYKRIDPLTEYRVDRCWLLEVTDEKKVRQRPPSA